MKRKNDSQSKPHFRTNRVFREGEQWFFKVRGGGVMGPYLSELEVSSAMETFIRNAQSGLLSEKDEAGSAGAITAV